MKFENILQTNTEYQIREEYHQGKKHIVVPVVMMREGVHNGSHGPLFHPADELGRFPASWNGMPVMINHPKVNGVYVSANDPRVIDNEKIGTVYNTSMQEDKLKAEVWIDEQRLLAVSPSTLERINNGEMLDVSVGVFNDEEPVEGIWNNENYTSIARNHRPDHLAILPNEEGACNVQDGCGLRANNKNEKGGSNEMNENDLKELIKNGYAVDEIPIQINQEGVDLKQLVRDLQQKLDAMDNGSQIFYCKAVFEDHIIYEVHYTQNGVEEFFRQDYTINSEDSSISFINPPVKVKKQVEYTPVNNSIISNIVNKFKKGGSQMKNQNGSPQNNCSDSVDNLIAHKATKFTEEDREFLQGLESEQLNKLFPVEEEKTEATPQTNVSGNSSTPAGNANEGEGEQKKVTEKVTEEDIKKVFSNNSNPEEAIEKVFPKEMADQFKSGLKLHREKRQGFIDEIVNHSDFSKEELQNWDLEGLEKLHKSVIPKGNFIGNSGQGYEPNVNQGEDVPDLLPPGVEENQK